MPMVTNAQNTAAKTEAIWVRDVVLILIFLLFDQWLVVMFAGPFRLCKGYCRERASFIKTLYNKYITNIE